MDALNERDEEFAELKCVFFQLKDETSLMHYAAQRVRGWTLAEKYFGPFYSHPMPSCRKVSLAPE